MDESKTPVDDEEMDMGGSNLQKTFGWFVVVNRIAQNDYTKHEVIYKSKIMEVLNQLSYLIEYDKHQMNLQKKQTKRL
jgi:hypothetical protein